MRQLLVVALLTAACTGSQGSVGPQGPQGNQGPKGDTGAKGDPGSAGATGPQGPAGSPLGVYDGNGGRYGTLLGIAPQLSSGTVLVTWLGQGTTPQANNFIYSARMSDGQFIYPVVSRLVYTSADCSGQAYVVTSESYYPSNLYVTDVAFTGQSGVPSYQVTALTSSITPASQKVNETCGSFVGSGARLVAAVTAGGEVPGTIITPPISIH